MGCVAYRKRHVFNFEFNEYRKKSKGEEIMPVPHGVISTSEGPVDPTVEAPIDAEEAEDIAAFDAAMAELVEEVLPEAQDGVLTEEE